MGIKCIANSLRIFLKDVAGASPREIQSNLPAIRRILSHALEYLKQVEEMREERRPELTISQPTVKATVSQPIPLPSIGVEGTYLVIRIPLIPGAIEFTKKQIKQLPDWLIPWLEYAKVAIEGKSTVADEEAK